MTCDTLIRTDPDGRKHYRPKKPYNTLEEAITQAKKMNAEEKTIHKVVAYKCKYCNKYHNGRSKKELTEKERLKYQNEIFSKLKVIGKIDLEKFK